MIGIYKDHMFRINLFNQPRMNTFKKEGSFQKLLYQVIRTKMQGKREAAVSHH